MTKHAAVETVRCPHGWVECAEDGCPDCAAIRRSPDQHLLDALMELEAACAEGAFGRRPIDTDHPARVAARALIAALRAQGGDR